LDDALRLLRAHGKSYPDMIKMRAGRPGDVPDAVVSPHNRTELQEVLTFCSEHAIAVVPFGGGTSVVGGLAAIKDGFDACISLDLSFLAGLEALDETSGLATFLPGTRGPAAEAALKEHGFTLGHYPQSFEYGSIGGFVATRSAGQSSSGYGRIDHNVIGLAATTPTGRLDIPAIPGTAAGPDLRQLLTGSEGTLGVLDRLDLQVVRSPQANRDTAWLAPSFEAGREALRLLEQTGLAPTVARLSDEEETRVNLMLSGSSATSKAFRSIVSMRGGGCLMIVCFEGNPSEVAARSQSAGDVLRKAGCKSLGGLPAKAWRKGRFAGPYARDTLMDLGYFVETLETATTWSGLSALHAAVSSSLRTELGKAGGDPLVMCHLSHMYPTGASLYFTFLGRTVSNDLDERLAQWWAVKSAACDAIVSSGGTITHHHAVGRDHAPWLASEIGDRGVAVLRAAKAELDPNGVMNPGRLFAKTG
jgi:alkyldihydroxyacetonephosphate synthase